VYRRLIAIPDDLVAAATAGDDSAQSELYLRLRPLVTRLLVALLGEGAPLQDLLDDICVDLMLGLGKFRRESQFTTWAYSVAVRRVAKWRRSVRAQRIGLASAGTVAVGDAPSPPDEALARREVLRAVREAILRLPRRLQLCVVLVDVLGTDPAEVADVVGGTPRSVRDSTYKARLRIRGDLADRGFLEGRDEGFEVAGDGGEMATSPAGTGKDRPAGGE